MSDSGLIEITRQPISPERVINLVKTDASGCVVSYVGLIRNSSRGKEVTSVEYEDTRGNAAQRLGEIAEEIRQKWPIEKMAVCHRIGKLKVGDINFLVAVASAHRKEGLAACSYAVDRFKELLPTRKTETYADGTSSVIPN
jgi:molybdopterin synthase catalytic subunit